MLGCNLSLITNNHFPSGGKIRKLMISSWFYNDLRKKHLASGSAFAIPFLSLALSTPSPLSFSLCLCLCLSLCPSLFLSLYFVINFSLLFFFNFLFIRIILLYTYLNLFRLCKMSKYIPFSFIPSLLFYYIYLFLSPSFLSHPLPSFLYPPSLYLSLLIFVFLSSSIPPHSNAFHYLFHSFFPRVDHTSQSVMYLIHLFVF